MICRIWRQSLKKQINNGIVQNSDLDKPNQVGFTLHPILWFVTLACHKGLATSQPTGWSTKSRTSDTDQTNRLFTPSQTRNSRSQRSHSSPTVNTVETRHHDNAKCTHGVKWITFVSPEPQHGLFKWKEAKISAQLIFFFSKTPLSVCSTQVCGVSDVYTPVQNLRDDDKEEHSSHLMFSVLLLIQIFFVTAWSVE